MKQIEEDVKRTGLQECLKRVILFWHRSAAASTLYSRFYFSKHKHYKWVQVHFLLQCFGNINSTQEINLNPSCFSEINCQNSLGTINTGDSTAVVASTFLNFKDVAQWFKQWCLTIRAMS